MLFLYLIGAFIILGILSIYIMATTYFTLRWFSDIRKIFLITLSIVLFILFNFILYKITGLMTVVIILYFSGFSIAIDLIYKILIKIKVEHSFSGIITNLYKARVLPVFLTIVILSFGYFNMINVIKTTYDLTTTKLTAGEELRFALVSDLHLGNSLDSEDMEKYAQKIDDEKVDALFLAGDIVDESTSKDEMEKIFKVFGKVNTKNGVYFVYGNHDKIRFGDNNSFTDAELESNIVSNGIVPLSDETVSTDKLVIIGRVDYFDTTASGHREDINNLITSSDKRKYIIDLDHQPKDISQAMAAGVDLQLSGHTHGGQIWPAGLLNNIFHFNEVEYGHEKNGNYNIIVSSGISGWNFPIRTEKHSEYVIINLKGVEK